MRAFKTYGTIESTGDLTVGGNTEITGNLTVLGTTTALSTTEMEVKDNFIHLSKGASAGAYAKDLAFTLSADRAFLMHRHSSGMNRKASLF